jgi:hypothetical protein
MKPTGECNMKKAFFSLTIVIVLILSACMPSPPPTLARPTGTAAMPTQTAVTSGNTFIITSDADSGPGTLRQATLDAQNGDIITFDPSVFPPDAPVTIFITSELTWIMQGNLTIDASNAGVILDGSKLPQDSWIPGIAINSENNTIQGLQIINFTGAGIALYEHASHNLVGGNRNIGSSPIGQGNLSGANLDGIGLMGATDNIITGNLIGVDSLNTTPLPIRGTGIFLTEGSERNVIGPDNVIAFSGDPGVDVRFVNSEPIKITRNSIYDNVAGIRFLGRGISSPIPPVILSFDVNAGIVEGLTCPLCEVEVFSGKGPNAEDFEGSTVADQNGWFKLMKSAPFAGPSLTATSTERNGSTSEFSLSTVGNHQDFVLQHGNDLPRIQVQSRQSKYLEDNRMSTQVEARRSPREAYDQILVEVSGLGVKRIRLSFNEFEVPFDLAPTEFTIHPADDAWIDKVISNGIAITYVMTFWDKEYQIGGGELGCQRFKKEDEIQRYLEYVRFIVRHFRDRIQDFEIWNEPNAGACPQEIEVADYVEVVRRTVPIIRQGNPEAKVIVGAVGAVNWLDDPVAQNYTFTLISSDVMPMVDGISWHPLYGISPQYPDAADYYNTYPSMLQRIVETASIAGFRGEYYADELSWWTQPPPDKPPWVFSEITSAKYFARGVILHLGMDVNASPMVGTLNRVAYATVGNLSTVMAGNKSLEISVEIKSDATHITSYGFSLPNGDRLFAMWNDNVAVGYDPGVPSTLTFPDTSAQKVIGIDVIHGFEQELIIENENGNLVIRNFLIKDYPIILRLVD